MDRIENAHVLDVGLPKWAGCLVTCHSTPTKEQLLEMCTRLDDFTSDPAFYSRDYYYSQSNNTNWDRWASEAMGMFEVGSIIERFIEAAKTKFPDGKAEIGDIHFWAMQNLWKKHFSGRIVTDGLRCETLSTSYVGGIDGWLRHDGLHTQWKNVGKYVSVEDVYNDLVSISTEYNDLEIRITLHDQEYCNDETSPAAAMYCKDGIVHLVDVNSSDYNREKFHDIDEPPCSSVPLNRLASILRHGRQEWPNDDVINLAGSKSPARTDENPVNSQVCNDIYNNFYAERIQKFDDYLEGLLAESASAKVFINTISDKVHDTN